MKFKLAAAKPRNPYVAACLRRKSGAHSTGNRRQQFANALRREIAMQRAELLKPDT